MITKLSTLLLPGVSSLSPRAIHECRAKHRPRVALQGRVAVQGIGEASTNPGRS